MARRPEHNLDGGGRVYCAIRKGQPVGAWRMEFSRGRGDFRMDINQTTKCTDVQKAKDFANAYARLIAQATNIFWEIDTLEKGRE